MEKTAVIEALNKVRDAHKQWNNARLKFKADESAVMRRLVMEGAVNYMSPEDIAAQSGMSERNVRSLLRAEGLDPRRSKPQLAKHAARTLADNAALLGMEPREMDLTSPLAYLPMGSALKEFMGASVTADDLADSDEEPHWKVDLTRNFDKPDECKVYLNGVLYFHGFDASASMVQQSVNA